MALVALTPSTPPRLIRALHVASELAPYTKTGGLAQVVRDLPREMQQTCRVATTVVTPWYRDTDSLPPGDSERADRVISVGPYRFDVSIHTYHAEGEPSVAFVEIPALFDRPAPYGRGGHAYPDNPLRFAALCEAAADLCARDSFDIVHAHDWHAAPLVLRGVTNRAPTVFTIHNLAFQGVFPQAWGELAGFDRRDFDAGTTEFYGQLNLLKGALIRADAVTTVSEAYAAQIRTEAYGCGLHGVLSHDVRRLHGVRNGIADDWDPRTDPHIAATFSADDITGKRTCRSDLSRAFGIASPEDDVPVCGVISRLTHQKGLDILPEILAPLLREGRIQCVVLGDGDATIAEAFRTLAKTFPDRVGVHLGIDEGLAHRIEAGADLFLMPSRFEPCGLNQLYSMRYGTLPLVHETGGLGETVCDITRHPDRGTGFTFHPFGEVPLRDALERALLLFRSPNAWQRAMQRAMRTDVSWAPAARAYRCLYDELLDGSVR